MQAMILDTPADRQPLPRGPVVAAAYLIAKDAARNFRRRLPPGVEPDDLAHDVTLTLLDGRASAAGFFDMVRNCPADTRRVVGKGVMVRLRSRVRELWRNRRTRARHFLNFAAGATHESHPEAGDRSPLAAAVRAALAACDPADAELVRAKFFDGLTEAQVAVRFGLRSRQVARRRLREALDRLGPRLVTAWADVRD